MVLEINLVKQIEMFKHIKRRNNNNVGKRTQKL